MIFSLRSLREDKKWFVFINSSECDLTAKNWRTEAAACKRNVMVIVNANN